MAASGIVFILYVLAHMYGNLKAFSGHDAYNEYAHHLRTLGEPMLPYEGFLWIMRAALILALVVHVYSAVALWRRANSARSQKYVVKKNIASSLSSRTMRWGGVILALFILYHILHLTLGVVGFAPGQYQHPEAGVFNTYTNTINAFRFWPSTLIANSWNSSAAFGCGAFVATPTPFTRAIAGGSTNQSIGAPLFLSCSAL